MTWNVWAQPLSETEARLTEAGFPRYRAKQIHDYLYRRFVYSFDDMKQLPETLRTWLKEHAAVIRPERIRVQRSSDGETTKLLLKLPDGSLVETVCMHHDYGNSICVSTQVGCAMGCIFCASTLNGCKRNITAGEMLAQVYAFLEEGVDRIHSIVLMGSGEPLHNYDEVLRFIHLCHDEEMLHLSYRNITLSTVGIVPQIYRLADEGLPITLAISLHAPNDVIRNHIVPASRHFAMDDLLRAAAYYFRTTGRRITFEYILIHGINDSEDNAKELASRVGKLNCHINLIPINGNEHIQLLPPSKKGIRQFESILARAGKSVTVRRQMGDEIEAACGQLKRRYLDKK